MRQTPDCLENNPSSRIPLGTIPSASLSSAFRAPANAPEDFVRQFPDSSSGLPDFSSSYHRTPQPVPSNVPPSSSSSSGRKNKTTTNTNGSNHHLLISPSFNSSNSSNMTSRIWPPNKEFVFSQSSTINCSNSQKIKTKFNYTADRNATLCERLSAFVSPTNCWRMAPAIPSNHLLILQDKNW